MLTSGFLLHDGVQKVLRGHVELIVELHGGKLDEPAFPGRELHVLQLAIVALRDFRFQIGRD